MYDSHIHIGSRLLEEEQQRHNYWLLTDCFLDGEKEFEETCRKFDEDAKKNKQFTLSQIRFFLEVPND